MATPRISGCKPIYGLGFGIPLGLIEALLIAVSAQSLGFPLAVTAGLLLYLVVPLGSSLLFSRRARVARKGYTVGVVTGISCAVTAVLATVIYGYLALVTAPIHSADSPSDDRNIVQCSYRNLLLPDHRLSSYWDYASTCRGLHRERNIGEDIP